MKTTIPSKSFVGYSRSRSVATTTGPCARPNHHQPHFLLSVFLRQAHPERDPLLPGEALASRRGRSGRFEASMRQATWRQVACFFESEEEFRAGHTKEARVENPAETSAPDPERADEMLVLRCPPCHRQAGDIFFLSLLHSTRNGQIEPDKELTPEPASQARDETCCAIRTPRLRADTGRLDPPFHRSRLSLEPWMHHP